MIMTISSSHEESSGRPEEVLISDSPVKSPKKHMPKSDFVKTRYGPTKQNKINKY